MNSRDKQESWRENRRTIDFSSCSNFVIDVTAQRDFLLAHTHEEKGGERMSCERVDRRAAPMPSRQQSMRQSCYNSHRPKSQEEIKGKIAVRRQRERERGVTRERASPAFLVLLSFWMREDVKDGNIA